MIDSWVEYPYPIWFFDHHSHVLTYLGAMIYIYIYSLGAGFNHASYFLPENRVNDSSWPAYVSSEFSHHPGELWLNHGSCSTCQSVWSSKLLGEPSGVRISKHVARASWTLCADALFRCEVISELFMGNWLSLATESIQFIPQGRVKTKNPTSQKTEPGIMSSSSGPFIGYQKILTLDLGYIMILRTKW